MWCVECSYINVDTFWLCSSCMKNKAEDEDGYTCDHTLHVPCDNFYQEKREEREMKRKRDNEKAESNTKKKSKNNL